jgi:hypothetical protein
MAYTQADLDAVAREYRAQIEMLSARLINMALVIERLRQEAAQEPEKS